jgi:hypothetical protein
MIVSLTVRELTTVYQLTSQDDYTKTDTRGIVNLSPQTDHHGRSCFYRQFFFLTMNRTVQRMTCCRTAINTDVRSVPR